MKYKGYSLRRAAKAATDNLSDTPGTGGVICLDDKGNGAPNIFTRNSITNLSEVALSMNSGGMFRGIIRADGKPLTAIFNDDVLS